MIGILCAMDSELEALQAELDGAKHVALCGYDYIEGTLRGRRAVLCKCGIGKVNAAVCAQAMLMRWPLRLVINSGVAGALQPPFQIGDICVATDLVQHDVDTTALGDPIGFVSTVNRLEFPCADWAVRGILAVAERLEGVTARPARVASGDQFITDGAVKARIVANFGASACEMEGGAIAQVCWINGVDCAVIRAISDSSDGKHEMEYRDFMPMAARNSARVVLEFLASL